MTIVEFLRQRLDEDEAAAKAAPGSQWQAFTMDDIAGASVYDEQWRLLEPVPYDHDEPMSNREGATGPQYIEERHDALVAHVARHDPARVLREVEAKRAIVDLAAKTPPGYAAAFTGTTLRFLAEVYADHPDFDPEWAILDESAGEAGTSKLT